MNNVQVNDILKQIRELTQQAGFETPVEKPEQADFASMLGESINNVNEAQQGASKLAASFEKGDPNVNLSQVMIEMQKARISFEALSQVRNKLLAAYQEIMNMQV